MDVKELLYIRGMDIKTYKCLESILSVYGTGKIDINSASKSTLKVLGFTEDEIEALLEARKEENIKDLDQLSVIVPQIKERRCVKWISFSPSGIYKIYIVKGNRVTGIFIFDATKNKVIKYM